MFFPQNAKGNLCIHDQSYRTDKNKKRKNGLILEQLLLGDFQIADLSGFWVQPRQDLSIGLST